MVSAVEQRLLQAWSEHQKGRIDHALSEYKAVLQAHPQSENAGVISDRTA